MFTGIIDHKAKVIDIIPRGATGNNGLTFLFETAFSHLAMGESIAVDGACLTVVKIESGDRMNVFSADLSSETLRLSTLSKKRTGDFVNVERALRLGDAMGGHWVTGHVDSVGQCEEIVKEDDFAKMTFSFASDFQHLVTAKGSITVNGVSLTINQVEPSRFSVMVIPHTADRTNLGTIKKGDFVNLEFDWMSKIILQQLNDRLERQAT